MNRTKHKTAELVPLLELAKRIPGGGNYFTARRWCLIGVKGVKLEHVRIGSRIFSSVAALDRFSQRVNAAAGNDVALASA